MTSTSLKPDAGYQASASYTQADWDEVSDNPPMTAAELAQLRPVQDVPEIYALLPKRPRGRPKMAAPKVNFTMRIDPAVLDAYKALGEGWQRMMQEGLSLYLGTLKGPSRAKTRYLAGRAPYARADAVRALRGGAGKKEKD